MVFYDEEVELAKSCGRVEARVETQVEKAMFCVAEVGVVVDNFVYRSVVSFLGEHWNWFEIYSIPSKMTCDNAEIIGYK